MRTYRWLVVLLLVGCVGMATAQAGPLSWLWPFGKSTPVKKPTQSKKKPRPVAPIRQR
jgi:hypothetical protein